MSASTSYDILRVPSTVLSTLRDYFTFHTVSQLITKPMFGRSILDVCMHTYICIQEYCTWYIVHSSMYIQDTFEFYRSTGVLDLYWSSPVSCSSSVDHGYL